MNHATNPSAAPSAENTFKLPVCDRAVTQEISGDFSLPDYQPEIKRLLRIGVSLLPPTAYASGENVELGGNMDYFVLYTGNDGMLYCAPLSSEYHFSVPMGDSKAEDTPLAGNRSAWMGDEPVCTCDLTAETVTGRVTAPRRLNIKCRLDAKVKAYATCPAGISPMATGEPAEALTATASCLRLFRGVGETLDLQDDMILPPGESDKVRIICAEGQVMLHEVTAGQDMVTCRGNALLRLTLAKADENGVEGIPTVSVRKIPFSQAVDMPGVTPDCVTCAHGGCASLSVEPEEGRLHTQLGLILEILAQKNLPTVYTKDMYATRHATKGSYAAYAVERGLQCINGNFTLSDSIPMADVGIPASARVVDATATATPRELSSEKGKYRLSGDCRVHLIWEREGELNASEMTLPFRYEFEDRRGDDADRDGQLCWSGIMQAVNCRARMDGERVGIDAELTVMLRTAERDTVTALTRLEAGEEASRRRGEYVICFPAVDDTLWSVAKRYNAPLAPLAAANGISVAAPDAIDSLEGVKYLIV